LERGCEKSAVRCRSSGSQELDIFIPYPDLTVRATSCRPSGPLYHCGVVAAVIEVAFGAVVASATLTVSRRGVAGDAAFEVGDHDLFVIAGGSVAGGKASLSVRQ